MQKGKRRKGEKYGYGKIKIDEHWLRWDEDEEVLRNGMGDIRITAGGRQGGGDIK